MRRAARMSVSILSQRKQRNSCTRQRLDEQKQEILYTRLPTSRAGDEHEDIPLAQQILDSDAFSNCMAVIILANGAVIGMETDWRDFQYWDVIEAVFLFIFLAELTFKLAVKGVDYLHISNPDFASNWFDMVIVGLGLFDFSSSLIGTSSTGGFATIFRMVRLMRVLRILRLLKFLKPLFLLAFGLVEACKAIVWVTLLMSCVLYVLSIVLVKTVGEPGEADPHYEFLFDHFCNIPTAMLTLFVLMSSPNLPVYQEEDGMLASRPVLCLFLIMFICFGSFGMLAMLTGVINESMFENNELRKEEKKLEHEVMRMSLGKRAAELYETLPLDEDGLALVEDVQLIAVAAARLLDEAGVEIAQGDIGKFLAFIDDDDSGVVDMKEFVQAMERIAEAHSPLAMVEVQHNMAVCKQKLTNQMQNIETMEAKIEAQVERTAEEVERILNAMFSTDRSEQSSIRETIEDQIKCVAEEVHNILEAVKSSQRAHRTEVVDKLEAQMLHTKENVDRILQVVTSKQDQQWTQLIEKMEIHMLRTADELHKILQAISGACDEHQAALLWKSEPSTHGAKGEGEAALLAVLSKQTHDIQIALDKKFSALESQLVLKDSSQAKLEACHSLMQNLSERERRDPIESLRSDLARLIESLRSDLARLMQESKNSLFRVARAQENVDILNGKVSLLEKETDAIQTGVLASVAELGGDIISNISELLSTSLAKIKQELVSQSFHALSARVPSGEGVRDPSREAIFSPIAGMPGAANRQSILHQSLHSGRSAASVISGRSAASVSPSRSAASVIFHQIQNSGRSVASVNSGRSAASVNSGQSAASVIMSEELSEGEKLQLKAEKLKLQEPGDGGGASGSLQRRRVEFSTSH